MAEPEDSVAQDGGVEGVPAVAAADPGSGDGGICRGYPVRASDSCYGPEDRGETGRPVVRGAGEGSGPLTKLWTLIAPSNVAWTPEQVRRIAAAVQDFQLALADFTVFVFVEVEGLEILPLKYPSRRDLRED